MHCTIRVDLDAEQMLERSQRRVTVAAAPGTTDAERCQ
jgi:hypothetical protein